MDREQIRIGGILRRAALDFERNGLSRSAIRKCEQEAPEAFLTEGLKVLIEADETAGYRFLAILLAPKPALFQRLCDQWLFDRKQAIAIAKALAKVDLNLDIRLANLLPDGMDTPQQFGLHGESAARALEILDEISPGRRIIPIMRHLTEHSDSKIASKAGLLIGKRLQNIAWARRVISESSDPRLRANALECFWGMNTPEVIDLFRESLEDEDNRVVGNAIIGLHEAGDKAANSLVSRIANEKKPEFRMTAAWTMGRIGDPAFLTLLTPLAKDSNPKVRRAALRSLRGFHQQAPAAETPDSESEPLFLDQEPLVLESEPEKVAVPEPSPGTIRPQRQFWG